VSKHARRSPQLAAIRGARGSMWPLPAVDVALRVPQIDVHPFTNSLQSLVLVDKNMDYTYIRMRALQSPLTWIVSSSRPLIC
jgi:hypothetical protein